jgi:predicted pyridoxine 5'-phosphate oxidase superfamily flavin-nucleotide-binding protein
MNKLNTIKEYIESVFQTSRFAVLATTADGQPHTSLIAITPVDGFRQLIFATYRNTLKYRNIMNNSKVAVLIEGEHVNVTGLKEKVVLTIIGYTEDSNINEAAFQAHLKRHPQMESFMLSPDCALVLVIARSFQVVYGIEDIRWISVDDLYSA